MSADGTEPPVALTVISREEAEELYSILDTYNYPVKEFYEPNRMSKSREKLEDLLQTRHGTITAVKSGGLFASNILIQPASNKSMHAKKGRSSLFKSSAFNFVLFVGALLRIPFSRDDCR